MLLAGCFCGLIIGFEVCLLFMYLPLKKRFADTIDWVTGRLEDQNKRLRDILYKFPTDIKQGNGSVISPIQINTEDK